MTPFGSAPRRAAPVFIVTIVSAALFLSSCSTSGTGPPSSSGTGSSSAATTTRDPTTRDTTPLDGFRTTTITVVAADGSTRTYCVLVADTDALRRQGLMFVEDRSLGGHDGMLFVFDEDVAGGFWMRNTLLPLSIAYLRADGTVLSSTDMAPCPDGGESCPTYPSRGRYRYALEVPQGELARVGVVEGATVQVGSEGCARREPSSTS